VEKRPTDREVERKATRAIGRGVDAVHVEWLSSVPLGAGRAVSRVPLSSLCGGALELAEKCDTLLWGTRQRARDKRQSVRSVAMADAEFVGPGADLTGCILPEGETHDEFLNSDRRFL